MEENFDPDLIHEIFKLVWSRRNKKVEGNQGIHLEGGAGTSKKTRATTVLLQIFMNTANASALKVSCELLRLFVAEAIQRAALIAEAEGIDIIEPTHLERVLPQLLLDF
ncbi:Centromere protein X [Rhynchospora pubera]|uniref:Centromere protein X n=1 Tax=Rhynchospora pubera TaxID=906938 RepID=A0AAV8D4Y6_9POAL|nr:Centromere protein X [Rhynchospora pubera]